MLNHWGGGHKYYRLHVITGNLCGAYGRAGCDTHLIIHVTFQLLIFQQELFLCLSEFFNRLEPRFERGRGYSSQPVASYFSFSTFSVRSLINSSFCSLTWCCAALSNALCLSASSFLILDSFACAAGMLNHEPITSFLQVQMQARSLHSKPVIRTSAS